MVFFEFVTFRILSISISDRDDPNAIRLYEGDETGVPSRSPAGEEVHMKKQNNHAYASLGKRIKNEYLLYLLALLFIFIADSIGILCSIQQNMFCCAASCRMSSQLRIRKAMKAYRQIIRKPE